MKIVLLIFGFVFISFWLAVIIGVGVKAGLKSYFDKSSKGGN